MLVAVTTALPAAVPVSVAAVNVCPLSAPVPDTDHVTPLLPTSFATVAVKFNAWDTTIPPRLGVSATVTPPPLAACTVIVADADFVVSATEVAFSVTVAGVGTAPGAVYVTAAPDALVVGATDPQAAPLHPVPVTVQVTPLFAESFATVAVKDCVAFTAILAEGCDTVTTIGAAAAVTVIVAEADFDVSATEVAFKVTAAGLGTAVGAV